MFFCPQSGFVSLLGDEFRKIDLFQIRHRNIDSDLELEPGSAPNPALPDRLYEHRVGKFIDQAVFFGDRDKGVRRDHATCRTLPPDQAFATNNRPCRDFDFRLVEDDELVIFDRRL